MCSGPLGANLFITGANRGIGLGLLREILRVKGVNNVFAGCRDPEGAKDIHELQVSSKALHLVKIDVADDHSIRTAFAQVQQLLVADGGLNLLINNAGILEKEGGSLQEPDREVFVRHFDVNLVGTVMLTAALLPLLKKAASAGEHARVVNIGSALGCIANAPKPAMAPHRNVAYGMSKAAMHHFNKQLALGEPDITSVAIHPGWVRTEMGGPQAPIAVEQAAQAILRRVCALRKDDSGKLLDHEKELAP